MTKLLTIEYKKTLWTFILIMMVMIAGYLFFVSSSVFNTVALKDAEIQSSQVRSKLAGIEAKYVAFEKTIDKEKATVLGFREVKGNVFSYNGLTSSVSRANVQ